ncbi:hypothetical protein C2869_07380 [Saccharobesus litoralis]|uniref:Uncharacterized protein n=1 Tax=Saccharobesus litoralis TaxID=2172099 RepID=A0A2S0VPW6_9ALTE|nr:hypothetical protein C2869_07380 [Saccharobesus litoralis]
MKCFGCLVRIVQTTTTFQMLTADSPNSASLGYSTATFTADCTAGAINTAVVQYELRGQVFIFALFIN